MVLQAAARSRRSSGLSVLLMALVLAGCSSGEVSGRLATYDADGGMDALLTGTLRVTAECVTVEADGAVYTPAFDGGADLDADVLRFRGAEYDDGATIELGGGDAGDLAGVRIPPGCPRDHVFLVAPR